MIRLSDELLADPDESCNDPRRAVVRLTVRDQDDRVRRAERRGWALLCLLILLTTVGGLWGAWDRQPMGEQRTHAQEVQERG